MAKEPKSDAAEKPAKAPKAPKAEKADKPAKAPKAEKGEKGDKKKGKAAEPEETGPAPAPRLRDKYFQTVLPTLAEKFGRKNTLSLPRLDKIVVNMGVGAA